MVWTSEVVCGGELGGISCESAREFVNACVEGFVGCQVDLFKIKQGSRLCHSVTKCYHETYN